MSHVIVKIYMRNVLFAERYFNTEKYDWLVLVHGAGGSIKTWKRQAGFFKKHFNVLLIDLRDHGRSKELHPAFESYNFEITSNDLKDVMDYHQISKANFITLSFGSVLIQDFIKKHPNYVNKLVFAGAVLGGGIMLRSFVFLAQFLNLFLSFPTMYKLFSYILMPKKENQFARRLYLSQAKKLNQEEYLKWLGLYNEFFKLLKSFKDFELHIPSLIMMGSQDFMFLKSAERYALTQEQVALHVIEGAGHIVNIERATEFNQKVYAFLSTRKDQSRIPATSLLSETN